MLKTIKSICTCMRQEFNTNFDIIIIFLVVLKQKKTKTKKKKTKKKKSDIDWCLAAWGRKRCIERDEIAGRFESGVVSRIAERVEEKASKEHCSTEHSDIPTPKQDCRVGVTVRDGRARCRERKHGHTGAGR